MADYKARRQFLVNKKIQLPYAMTIVIQASIITIFLGMCLYWINKEYLSLLSVIAKDAFPKSTVDKIINTFLFKILAVLGINAILLVIVGIHSSHNFAGPIHRLTNYFNEIARGTGKLAPIKFRKKDTLKEVADAFNLMTENLEKKKDANKEITDKIKDMLSMLSSGLKNNSFDKNVLYDIANEIGILIDKLDKNNKT